MSLVPVLPLYDKRPPPHAPPACFAGARALLDDSDGEDDNGHLLHRNGGRGAAGVERERAGGAHTSGAARVKPERGLGGGGGGGGGGGFVDLTKPEIAPLRVGGRTVAADEIAVCDLLDSDDEQAGGRGGGGARWEVRKRQVVEVEGGGDG